MKIRARWLWLLLLVPVIIGLFRLRLDVEVLDLLPSDIPSVAGLKLYQQHFANARELILTLEAPDPELAENGARAIAECLRKETNLVAKVIWEPLWLEQPGLAGELIGYLWFNQPPAVFGDLTNRLSSSNLPKILADTREQLANSMSPDEIARGSYDPYGLTRLPEGTASAGPGFGPGQDMFSASNGLLRIVFIQASRDLSTYEDCRHWLDEVHRIVDGAIPSVEKGKNEFRIGYTGRPAFVAEISAGMQHDMTYSVGGTAIIIAILFWLAHRRIKPMLWLLTLLAIILGCTLSLGGLIYGSISVVSMGFAAILLGLAVDYAVVHYQEALAHPNLSIPEIRRAIAPSIFWAAITTISAFLVLNFGGLPGLGQLGTLVGLGVALSACIMIFEFLPPLFPERRYPRTPSFLSSPTPNPEHDSVGVKRFQVDKISGRLDQLPQRRISIGFFATGIVVLFTATVLGFLGPPSIDPTANALRPRNSPSYETLQKVQSTLGEAREPLWLIIEGKTEHQVAIRLQEVESVLTRASSNNQIAGFTMPTPIWPRPEFQAGNRPIARDLAGRREMLHQAALTNGFAPSALGLTDLILDNWQAAAATTGVFWPTNQLSQWILEKTVARTSTNCFAIGLVKPLSDQSKQRNVAIAALESQLPSDSVWLSGWELLGHDIFGRVKANMWKVLGPMIFLVLLSLWLAFRDLREILQSMAVLFLSALILLGVMRMTHWSWNLLNLMALPLILGTGVDYSIFMQLALRRYHGDLGLAYRSVGRALLLCGGTAIAGFGSLGLSTNAGMASLGQVCAIGIAGNMLISIFLLPIWWYWFKFRDTQVREPKAKEQI